jgi:prepilin-type N-terminal cleavage/methylation domain-containing protein
MDKLIKQAFTLIELLVVIAIIGILSGLIVVSMGGVTQKANVAKAQVFSNSLRNSLMIDMISEWKFDGTSTDGSVVTSSDVLDTWSSVNNGSVGGSPIVRTGSNCVNGSCIEFGTSNYIGCGISTTLDVTDITVEAWALMTSMPTTEASLVSKGAQGSNNHFWLYYQPTTTRFYLEYSNGTTRTSAVCPIVSKLNTWFNVVGTYDGTTGYCYVDGIRGDAKTTLSGNMVANNQTLTIGRYSANGAYYWPGRIDNVRLYKTAASTSQIKELYYVGLNKLLSSGSITREEYNQRIVKIAEN